MDFINAIDEATNHNMAELSLDVSKKNKFLKTSWFGKKIQNKLPKFKKSWICFYENLFQILDVAKTLRGKCAGFLFWSLFEVLCQHHIDLIIFLYKITQGSF